MIQTGKQEAKRERERDEMEEKITYTQIGMSSESEYY